MNKRAEQKAKLRAKKKIIHAPQFRDLETLEVANDTDASKQAAEEARTKEVMAFERFIRSEKRSAFWGGIFMAFMALMTVTTMFLLLSANGIHFMTCQEFGETFTCRLGGM
ncbi:MAG: hypothetical protein AAF988_05510 [Pseudomonadota bacterium]